MIYFAMELANRINRDHPSDVNGCHGAKKKCLVVLGNCKHGSPTLGLYIFMVYGGKNLRYYMPIACCDVIGFYRRGMK
jgi:hypothetical protein